MLRSLFPVVLSAIAITLASCAGPQRAPADTASNGLDGLAWLSGSWAGEHDGGMIEEHWTMPEGGMMVGMSKLVIDGKAVFFEHLRIARNADGTIDYIAQPLGKPPTKFRLTTSGATSATFENPQHDDPQQIRYQRMGNHLQAVTDGQKADGQRSIHTIDMRRSRLVR